MQTTSRPGLRWLKQGAALSAGLVLLAGCQREQPLDLDMRGLAQGFSTATATEGLPARPRPDDRGVISYPNYQVVVARRGDTVASIAGRLGLDAASVASYNGLTPATELQRDEIVALPSRVGGAPAAAPATAPTAPIAAPGTVAVTDLAAAAIDRAEAATPAAAPASAEAGPEPIRHQVQRGETAYQLARRYGVPVAAIAEWNGLSSDLAIREGQQLLIPRGGNSERALPADPAAAEPGAGSATPVPPSAAEPLPEETLPIAAASEPEAAPPVASPDLGSQQTEAASSRLVRPVEGAIIRAYAPGRNEGIDIGAAAGSPVRAADAGTVAAITTNTDGVQIVVIRHEGDLLTVYTHVDDLSVERGSQVRRGQEIGNVRAGDPAFLHFEVREGMVSQDPTGFLP